MSKAKHRRSRNQHGPAARWDNTYELLYCFAGIPIPDDAPADVEYDEYYPAECEAGR